MINLFHVPTYKIDTANYSNLLHDKVVKDFEEAFAAYVGAKYAVSLNSASSAIFLIFSNWYDSQKIQVPSIIPLVVPNEIINSNNKVNFTDNVEWVGDSYILHQDEKWTIIDSAQKVTANQYKIECKRESDIIIYSFYPTKPVGSCDGGMVVSDDKMVIDIIRTLSMNGMSSEVNNWERKMRRIGHKMYMNSIQATIAHKNLMCLDQKKEALNNIRERYNGSLDLNNTSDHLYRIEVSNRDRFIQKGKERGITFGIHYESAHKNRLYLYDKFRQSEPFVNSRWVARVTVSIPFHENLTPHEVETVLQFIKLNR